MKAVPKVASRGGIEHVSPVHIVLNLPAFIAKVHEGTVSSIILSTLSLSLSLSLRQRTPVPQRLALHFLTGEAGLKTRWLPR